MDRNVKREARPPCLVPFGMPIGSTNAVEWGVYWRCLPASSDEESPRLAVLAGTDIEAV